MRIVIETILHKEHRYSTVGDYFNGSLHATRNEYTATSTAQGKHELETSDDAALIVRVSDVDDWRMEALVGIHELVEAVLCLDKGISQESVDEFDIAFEKSRDKTRCRDGSFDYLARSYDGNAEPGDSPDAPYHIQHGYATAVERMLCAAMNIPWADYEARLGALDG